MGEDEQGELFGVDRGPTPDEIIEKIRQVTATPEHQASVQEVYDQAAAKHREQAEELGGTVPPREVSIERARENLRRLAEQRDTKPQD